MATGNWVEQVTGGRKAKLDGDLAHKGKYSTYDPDGENLEVTLGADEGYCKISTTASYSTTVNLPDVSAAKGRRITIEYAYTASKNFTVVYTGTNTGNATVSSVVTHIYRSDGNNWIVEA